MPCIVDGMYPEVGEAVAGVLQRLGLTITCPADQTCCGQPAFNSGFRKQASIAARRFIDIFEKAPVIVCPSGSCVNMVRHHYPELFRDDPAWLKRSLEVGTKTFEFTQYLVDVLGVDDVGSPYCGTVTYHDSCHLLRGLGIREQPRKLIRSVKGATLIEMDDADRCCGFGGAFSFRYPNISSAIVSDKISRIVQTGADAVVSADMGCLMNISGFLSRKKIAVQSLHIAQVLYGNN